MSTQQGVPEVMVKAMAAQVKDGDRVLHGLASPLPVLAMALAKLTHAPNAVLFSVAEGLDPDVHRVRLALSSADPALAQGAVAFTELVDAFDLCQRGELDVMFLGAAQVDMYGNTNLSAIGDYAKPKVRLPGGAATAHMMSLMPKTVIWAPRQSARNFVPRVDFRTGVGYLHGGDSREASGARPTTLKLVSNLAVYGFDPRTGIMRAESLHPGVTPDAVRENTGFGIDVPDDLPVTPAPDDKELELISGLDPDGVRYSEFR
ncbi:MAG: CoA-transferase subunit beta [Chloroflexota bacterium]